MLKIIKNKKIHFITIVFIIFSVSILWGDYFDDTIKIYNYKNKLHTAIINNNYKSVKSLLKQGLDANKIEEVKIPIFIRKNTYFNHPVSPLYIAILKNNPNIVKILLDNNAKIKNDMLLISISSPKISKILIKHGADIHKTDSEGRNCLHWLVLKGNFETFKYILKYNIDINSKDNNGFTVLGLAKQFNKNRIYKYIIKNTKYSNLDKSRTGNPKIISKSISLNKLNNNLSYDHKNPYVLLKGITARPHRINSKIIGYKFMRLRTYNIFHSLFIRSGDIITRINNKKVESVENLLSIHKLLKPNRKLHFDLLRNKKHIKIIVKLNK